MDRLKNNRGDTSYDMSPAAFNRDQGGIQTLDLQNRNLTLYSLSYPAKDSAKVYIIKE